jgi:hypothetical protein
MSDSHSDQRNRRSMIPALQPVRAVQVFPAVLRCPQRRRPHQRLRPDCLNHLARRPRPHHRSGPARAVQLLPAAPVGRTVSATDQRKVSWEGGLQPMSTSRQSAEVLKPISIFDLAYASPLSRLLDKNPIEVGKTGTLAHRLHSRWGRSAIQQAYVRWIGIRSGSTAALTPPKRDFCCYPETDIGRPRRHALPGYGSCSVLHFR